MSTIVSMCSMFTGHAWTQAPQVVQSQMTSSSTTSGFRAGNVREGGLEGFITARVSPSRSCGPRSNNWSRRSMINNFGDSGFPVFHAGHCD